MVKSKYKKRVTYELVDMYLNKALIYKDMYKSDDATYWQGVFLTEPYWVVYNGEITGVTGKDIINIKNRNIKVDYILNINNSKIKKILTRYIEGIITKKSSRDELYKELLKTEKNYKRYLNNLSKLDRNYKEGKIDIEKFNSKKSLLMKKCCIEKGDIFI